MESRSMARYWLLTSFLLLRYASANDPACSKSLFTAPDVPGAEVLSITAVLQRNFSSSSGIPSDEAVNGFTVPFCDVEVHLTHPGADDDVKVKVWLPSDDWNGRFQATGGGGFATGMFDIWLAPAVQAGYSAASTDGGHGAGKVDYVNAEWLLNPNGSINWPLLQNFASRSLADQIYVGKSITEQYYGKAPHHSYWSGCSTGGRQGYLIAQKYPHLLDGILAIAPALHFSDFVVGEFWPQLVMKEDGRLISKCEFDWFAEKVLAECDILDGVQDGVIEDPEICDFDLTTLVGQKFVCDDDEVEVTQTVAEIVRKIHEGPKTPFGAQLAHPLPYGTRLDSLAGIKIDSEGVRIPAPFGISESWIRNALLRHTTSSFNISSLTVKDYLSLWVQSQTDFAWLLNTENPDLGDFKKAGGKLLSWHGLADQLISYHNVIRYRKRVALQMGGEKKVDEFYRLFLAPGVEHCVGGAGPLPVDALDKLVDWVENGESPDRLAAENTDANGDKLSRDLCPWPKTNRYMGIGNGKRASSWSCEGGDDETEEKLDNEKPQEFLGGLKQRLLGLGMNLNIA